MLWIILVLILLAAIIGPGIWVRHILRKYSEPADRYRQSGSGAELARHLLERFGLHEVKVEETETGDHYDPRDQTVRLSADNYHGHSLTAVAVATHEVGHAIQHSRNEALFSLRQRLVKAAVASERIGGLLLIAAPVIMVVSRTPQLGLLSLLAVVATMAVGTVVHLVTLPGEFDASFNKARPILEDGNYLREGDLPHARRILQAAALTYVAGSLASLLNLGRWIAILRR